MTAIATALTLPCGAILPNRIAKGAMTEGLSKNGFPRSQQML